MRVSNSHARENNARVGTLHASETQMRRLAVELGLTTAAPGRDTSRGMHAADACGGRWRAGGVGRARACVAPQEGLRGADARVQHIAGQVADRLPARHQVQQRALACAAAQLGNSREAARRARAHSRQRSCPPPFPAARSCLRGAAAWQCTRCEQPQLADAWLCLSSHEPARSARPRAFAAVLPYVTQPSSALCSCTPPTCGRACLLELQCKKNGQEALPVDAAAQLDCQWRCAAYWTCTAGAAALLLAGRARYVGARCGRTAARRAHDRGHLRWVEVG